jgi:hypothetical protein
MVLTMQMYDEITVKNVLCSDGGHDLCTNGLYFKVPAIMTYTLTACLSTLIMTCTQTIYTSK